MYKVIDLITEWIARFLNIFIGLFTIEAIIERTWMPDKVMLNLEWIQWIGY